MAKRVLTKRKSKIVKLGKTEDSAQPRANSDNSWKEAARKAAIFARDTASTMKRTAPTAQRGKASDTAARIRHTTDS